MRERLFGGTMAPRILPKRTAIAKPTFVEAPERLAGPYWLLKSEPDDYSIGNLEADIRTRWDGIRSAAARANLRRMQVGDLALFYHSSAGPKLTGIVGEARIVREAYPDPIDESWACVDIEFVRAIETPLLLRDLKLLAQRPEGAPIASMALFKQSRLSVQPVPTLSWAFLTGGAALRAIAAL
jgi:predicted RNA-binding protein with PUA-like domain